jgi:hypothetical protein
MNFILLQNGYVIANIKGDHESRMSYYEALDKAHLENDQESFVQLVAETELQCLNQYLKILGGS